MALPLLVMNVAALSAVDMTANRTSTVYNVGNCSGFAVHAIWTGAPVGNIVVSGSNDGTNFKAVDTTAAGGVDGQRLYNADGVHYQYVQVSYAFTSGTGTLTAYLSAKQY